jgi:hypothetical protein
MSWKGGRTATKKVYLGDGRMQEMEGRQKGVLVMTSHKLVWVDERGLFGKSYHPNTTINLEDVEGVSIGGWVSKYVTIADKRGSHDFHLNGVGEGEFTEFRQTIVGQSNLRKSSISEEKRREKIQVMVDFSFLKQYMEKGGAILRTVKCMNCGASMALPETGKTVVCTHCGTIHYSEDIFEKIKQLIG